MKDIFVLGINFGHDSAVSLIRNGQLIAAIEEEKVSRVKQDFGWPRKAIHRLFKEHQISPSQIDIIALSEQTLSDTESVLQYNDIDRILRTVLTDLEYKAFVATKLDRDKIHQIAKDLGLKYHNVRDAKDRAIKKLKASKVDGLSLGDWLKQ